MAKKKKVQEVVEVWEPGACPAPGCEFEGPHRHVLQVRGSPSASVIEGYGEATPIKEAEQMEQPESEH